MAGKVDINKMRERHEEHQRGGDFIQFDGGETLLYIHPPCRDDDKWEPTTGCPYIPVTVHYGVGKNGAMVVSLDIAKNTILAHPFMKPLLKDKKIRVPDPAKGEVCPIREALDGGGLTDEEMDEMRPQTRFMYGATVLGTRRSSKDNWAMVTTPKPATMFVGKQIFDGLNEVFFDHADITDPMAAILVRVIKSGDKRTTAYKVAADPASAKKNVALDKAFRARLLAATEIGGDCDLWRIVGNFMKSPAEATALLSGVKVEGDAGRFDDDDAAAKPAAKGKPAATRRPAPEPEPEPEVADDEALVDAMPEHSPECLEQEGACIDDCPVAIYMAAAAEQESTEEEQPAEEEPEAEATEEESTEEAAEEATEEEPEATEEQPEEEPEAEATEEEAPAEEEPEATEEEAPAEEEQVEEEPEAPPPPPAKKPAVKTVAVPAKPVAKTVAPAPAKPAPAKPAVKTVAVPAKPATTPAKPAVKTVAKTAPADEDLGLDELTKELASLTTKKQPAVPAKPPTAPAKAAVPAKPAAVVAKPTTAAKPAATPAKPAVKTAPVKK